VTWRQISTKMSDLISPDSLLLYSDIGQYYIKKIIIRKLTSRAFICDVQLSFWLLQNEIRFWYVLFPWLDPQIVNASLPSLSIKFHKEQSTFECIFLTSISFAFHFYGFVCSLTSIYQFQKGVLLLIESIHEASLQLYPFLALTFYIYLFIVW
jgi:hypothetical protein